MLMLILHGALRELESEQPVDSFTQSNPPFNLFNSFDLPPQKGNSRSSGVIWS